MWIQRKGIYSGPNWKRTCYFHPSNNRGDMSNMIMSYVHNQYRICITMLRQGHGEVAGFVYIRRRRGHEEHITKAINHSINQFFRANVQSSLWVKDLPKHPLSIRTVHRFLTVLQPRRLSQSVTYKYAVFQSTSQNNSNQHPKYDDHIHPACHYRPCIWLCYDYFQRRRLRRC